MALGFRPRYAPDVAVSSSLSATGVRWDLRDLEPDAEQATREWDELFARARDFAERRRGTVGSAGAQGLPGMDDEPGEVSQDAAGAELDPPRPDHTHATGR